MPLVCIVVSISLVAGDWLVHVESFSGNLIGEDLLVVFVVGGLDVELSS